jgi:hypothetical protein
MAWTDNELSTLAGLTKHEAEINNLAGTYTRKALSITVESKAVAVPNTITSIVAVKSNGTSAALVYAASKWTIPIGIYTRFICQAEYDYFSLLEGIGGILYSASGDYTLTLDGTDYAWVDLSQQSDWQPKIDMAKTMIYNEIASALSNYYHADEIDDVIDEITNPEVLEIASNYKTLELIYMDLYGKIGTQETINAKLSYYSQQYAKSFKSILPVLNFGGYGQTMRYTQGLISR